jgi:hypothetical protein
MNVTNPAVMKIAFTILADNERSNPIIAATKMGSI